MKTSNLPNNGPTTEAMPYIPPMSPVKVGRLAKGTDVAMMRYAPEKMPAEPRPAMARPMISAVLFGATPHMRDPSSKIATAARNTHLMEKNV